MIYMHQESHINYVKASEKAAIKSSPTKEQEDLQRPIDFGERLFSCLHCGIGGVRVEGGSSTVDVRQRQPERQQKTKSLSLCSLILLPLQFVNAAQQQVSGRFQVFLPFSSECVYKHHHSLM